QAEDGIRDRNVTGVQTCALPILAHTVWAATGKSWYKTEAGQITNNWSGSTVRYWWSTRRFDREHYRAQARTALSRGEGPAPAEDAAAAACRERAEGWGSGGAARV